MRQAPRAPRLLLKAGSRFTQLTPPQALAFSFLFLSLLGAVLLKIPAASTTPITWMQAIFTSTSASTVTGLGVIDIGTHLTLFGKWILIFLMQAGGLGLMSFGVFFIHLSRGSLSLTNRAALREALNLAEPGDLRAVLQWAFGFTALVEIVGTTLLSFHWVPKLGWSEGLFFSFFHSVAAFNNAGIALAKNNLIDHVANPLVSLVISFLFIVGGIGFVVVADVLGKKRFKNYRVHTKIMLVGTLVINLVAMMMLLAIEHGNPATLGPLDWSTKILASWFQAVTPRTAGFNTVDIGSLLPASVFLIMGLMFIGGGSGSTASGIKLSTFAVLLLATRSLLHSQDHPIAFGRTIPLETVRKAMAIAVISLFWVITGVFVLTLTERMDFLDLAFEAVSAFGTVGLSRGITANLSFAGQWVVMVLMLVGRVGPLTLAFTMTYPRKARIQFAQAAVNVG